ncbi:hypothetical protein [Amycolatopsis sp. DG1A-15b]|uniref:hypothetical protein n=1 Tax=Amycolatopsis sp. DG1A-15b TaxID=3052846 RepID=UPI00255B6C9B|nr:hypothetical protein [Amycolatopsis sp. DG1A-15b]WIX88727.1 hypothetical protein QRY02_47780 [Amycolatopsis sp. DG1A-15b]
MSANQSSLKNAGFSAAVSNGNTSTSWTPLSRRSASPPATRAVVTVPFQNHSTVGRESGRGSANRPARSPVSGAA